MAYVLTYHEDRVTRYLRELGLSRELRIRLSAALTTHLRQNGDFYRNDPERRLAPNSPLFWYEVLLHDTRGDGTPPLFRFIVSDEAAAYGVLRVVYVDVEVGPSQPG